MQCRRLEIKMHNNRLEKSTTLMSLTLPHFGLSKSEQNIEREKTRTINCSCFMFDYQLQTLTQHKMQYRPKIVLEYHSLGFLSYRITAKFIDFQGGNEYVIVFCCCFLLHLIC